MTTATQIDISVDQINDILSAAELEPMAVYADYSGRCMYGEECLGFVIDHNAQMRLGRALAQVLGEELAKEVEGHARTDSMGLDMIVYFPGVTAKNWEDDEEGIILW